jgi:2'-5' RNA ligase
MPEVDQNIYYVLGLFDEQTNQVFKQLNQTLSAAGIKPDDSVPHLTFGGYKDVSGEDLLEWVRTFCEEQTEIELNFNHIGLFPGGFCFIAPRVDKKLLKFHFDFHQNYDTCLTDIGYNFTLCSDNWVPHVTLVSGDRKAIEKTVGVLMDKPFKPFVGRLTEMAVFAYSPLREIGRAALPADRRNQDYSESASS